MKILFVTSDFFPRIGGGENYILNLAKELALNYHVSVITTNELDDGYKLVFGIHTYYYKFYKLLGNKFIKFILMYKHIKSEKPEIIYASGPSIMDFFSILFAKIYKTKSVITYHADLDLSKFSSQIFTYLYFIFCLPFFDHIIVTTETYRKKLIDRGINNNKLSVISVGFHKPTNTIFHHRMPVSSKPHPIRILFVGALDTEHRYKNVCTLLKCMTKLSQENFLLDIVGGGNLENYYISVSKQFKLKNVYFRGKVDEGTLSNYYANCDVFVLPSNSEQEGFGIVLLEALSLGCKIITGEMAGGSILFKDKPSWGETYNGTVEDLTSKIVTLSNKTINQNEIDLFIDSYSWKVVANKINHEIFDLNYE